MLVLAALWLGYARHFWMLHPTFPPNHVRQIMSEDARLHIEGVLYQEPERTEQRSRWVVRSQRVWRPAGAEEIRGYLLITIRHAAREWRYGDRVRFEVR